MATATKCNILLVGENIDKFKLYLSYKYNLVQTFELNIINKLEMFTFNIDTNINTFRVNLVIMNQQLLNFEIKKLFNIIDSILVLNEFKPVWLNKYDKFTIVKEFGSIDDILQCIYNKINNGCLDIVTKNDKLIDVIENFIDIINYTLRPVLSNKTDFKNVEIETNMIKIDKFINIITDIINSTEIESTLLTQNEKLTILKKLGSINDKLQNTCMKRLEIKPAMTDMDKLADDISRLYI